MSRWTKRSGFGAATALVWLAIVPGAAAQGTPTATGTGGAAASVDDLATQAAIDRLEQGGNAVDAAVDAAAVLGVTEPFSSGIGGGGFMLIRLPNGKVTTIDGRETAPATMDPRSFFEDGEPLNFNGARYSGISVGTPGTVATWKEALKRFGTIELGAALQSGKQVAREGFEIDETFFSQVKDNVRFFDDVPATARIYLKQNGKPRDVGSTQRNPDMAKAYAKIAKDGTKAFYNGRIARAILEAVQKPKLAHDADHKFRPGLLKKSDLQDYKALKRKPTKVGYRGLRIYGMGPPSSGGSTVSEILNILEGYEPLGDDRAEALHRFLEASRLSYADRGAYLADPAYFDVPLKGLLSNAYAAERRELIKDKAADKKPVEPGDPRGAGARLRSSTGLEGTSTTHLTVADSEGMVVSYTFTIESTGGSGIVVPKYGFLLNNELTDFAYEDPKAANKAEGGKRPRSSMAPTLVTESDGTPVLAVGSPGGSTIITTVAQVLIERLDLGKTLPEAIATPRLTQQNLETTLVEPAFLDTPEAAVLKDEYGHEFDKIDPPEIGAVAAIEFLSGGGFLAAAEPERRGGGSAAVVDPAP